MVAPDLTTCPVVFFGDEGGVFVVARDLLEVFRFLATRHEPVSTGDELTLYGDEGSGDDEDADPGAREAYAAWLWRHFTLTPADDAHALVRNAQAELGDRFTRWAMSYCEHL